jgi:hypothetical protein
MSYLLLRNTFNLIQGIAKVSDDVNFAAFRVKIKRLGLSLPGISFSRYEGVFFYNKRG